MAVRSAETGPAMGKMSTCSSAEVQTRIQARGEMGRKMEAGKMEDCEDIRGLVYMAHVCGGWEPGWETNGAPSEELAEAGR